MSIARERNAVSTVALLELFQLGQLADGNVDGGAHLARHGLNTNLERERGGTLTPSQCSAAKALQAGTDTPPCCRQ